MAIIPHNIHTYKKGYYSKIIGRKLVTPAVGSQSCQVWEQIIPPDGYITHHYHDFEETITLLTGCANVQIGNIQESVSAPATLFIPSHTIHSLTNKYKEPVYLLAFLATSEAKVLYPNDNVLVPVVWEDER